MILRIISTLTFSVLMTSTFANTAFAGSHDDEEKASTSNCTSKQSSEPTFKEKLKRFQQGKVPVQTSKTNNPQNIEVNNSRTLSLLKKLPEEIELRIQEKKKTLTNIQSQQAQAEEKLKSLKAELDQAQKILGKTQEDVLISKSSLWYVASFVDPREYWGHSTQEPVQTLTEQDFEKLEITHSDPEHIKTKNEKSEDKKKLQLLQKIEEEVDAHINIELKILESTLHGITVAEEKLKAEFTQTQEVLEKTKEDTLLTKSGLTHATSYLNPFSYSLFGGQDSKSDQ